MLELRDVTARYGSVVAIRDISVQVAAGEFVALIGVNGAGKTTLLRVISGLLRPASGSITFAGDRIDGRSAHVITRMGIAHVPEGRRVFPDLSVADNLAMGGFLWRNQRVVFKETLETVLTLFPRLAERRGQLAGTLSGGEQQMLAVGRALMTRPRLLLLDEPSLGLSPKLVGEMFEFFRDLHRRTGLTIVLVEQLASLALQLADRAYVLEGGSVALSGTGAELRNSPRVQAVYLGQRNAD